MRWTAVEAAERRALEIRKNLRSQKFATDWWHSGIDQLRKVDGTGFVLKVDALTLDGGIDVRRALASIFSSFMITAQGILLYPSLYDAEEIVAYIRFPSEKRLNDALIHGQKHGLIVAKGVISEINAAGGVLDRKPDVQEKTMIALNPGGVPANTRGKFRPSSPLTPRRLAHPRDVTAVPIVLEKERPAHHRTIVTIHSKATDPHHNFAHQGPGGSSTGTEGHFGDGGPQNDKLKKFKTKLHYKDGVSGPTSSELRAKAAIHGWQGMQSLLDVI